MVCLHGAQRLLQWGLVLLFLKPQFLVKDSLHKHLATVRWHDLLGWKSDNFRRVHGWVVVVHVIPLCRDHGDCFDRQVAEINDKRAVPSPGIQASIFKLSDFKIRT